MDLVDQWCSVLRLLSLPTEPRLLLASPDDERHLLTALSRACPEAATVVLHIGPRGRGTPGKRIGVADLVLGGSVMPGSVDAVLLDHVLDDLVLEAVARHEGIEADDGRGAHAQVLRALRAYWRSGELERLARPALAQLLDGCGRALRLAAPLILSHRVEGSHLPGQPLDLYTDYLALARLWVAPAELGFREILLDGMDPHWWMRLERSG